MCQYFRYQGISDDVIRLRLFPHTLRDKAIEWLDSQLIASITTWNDLAQKFCTKFFPQAKIAKLKHDISIFRQALKLYETMATTSAMWSMERAVPKKTPGVYEVDAYSVLSAKIDSLFHKMEHITQLANAAQTKKANCEECGAEHVTAECPILAQGKEQMAVALTGRASSSLSSNTEVNPKEHAKAITMRSRVELPERQVNNPMANKEEMSPEVEEILEQKEQTKEPTPRANKGNSRDKETVAVNPYEPPISKLGDHETVMLTEECSARIQKKLLPKLKDSGSFTIPCTIGDFYFDKALCDLGVSINLMPLSIFRKLGLGEPKATTVTLQLADRSLTHLRGIIEDAMKYPNEPESCFQIEVLDIGISYNFELKKQPNIHEACIVHSPSVLIDSKEIKTFNVGFHTDEERMTNHLEKDRDEI
ncbi:uncharacterized protein LOC111389057 [Olea europaea var. sylvestris]|uniref:uncharacterized protein LOC111389057 n=1 Tax=Olea europaea var. sylvestris TaxID=158386 RepID=UPI000C1CF548|nr:uncharacterized protein LOC111389057 [Olea europaea var. sylvestris]